MKSIVLIDPHTGGHHLMYLRVISKILLELGYQVLVFYPQVEPLVRWMATVYPAGVDRLTVLPMPAPRSTQIPVLGKLPQPLNVLTRWQTAATIAKTARSILGKPADLYLFNWLDDQFSGYLPPPLIDQLFPYPWAGLCFQPRLPFQLWEQAPGWFDEHAILNAHYCRGCGVLDDQMASQLQARVRCPVIAFPDFTDEATPDPDFPLVAQLRQQAQGRTIVTLLGSLNRRKGLLTLIDAALQLQAEPYFFAFMGELSVYTLSAEGQARMAAIVADPPANCLFHLERIPDEPQFNALVNASDILFAAYEKFPYSSNILTKAALFQKPVIASDRFCLGQRVRQYQLGCTIAEGDVGQCIAALRQIRQTPPDGQFAAYHQHHSLPQLHNALQTMLSHV